MRERGKDISFLEDLLKIYKQDRFRHRYVIRALFIIDGRGRTS